MSTLFLVVDGSNKKTNLRQMTLFQALCVKKYPNLVGGKFDQKVATLEAQWGEKEWTIGSNRDFFTKFGYSVQIWTRMKNENNRAQEVKLIFDGPKKLKLEILMNDFSENEPIHITQPIFYINDPQMLNFWSCPKKYCYFGTNRYDRLRKHVETCTDQTLIKYQQKKYEKIDSSIGEELYKEKIIPSSDFQNFYFCSYDVG